MCNSNNHCYCLERCKLTWREAPDKYSGTWILVILVMWQFCATCSSLFCSPFTGENQELFYYCQYRTLNSPGFWYRFVILFSASLMSWYLHNLSIICLLSMMLDCFPTDSFYLLQQEYSKRTMCTFSSVMEASWFYKSMIHWYGNILLQYSLHTLQALSADLTDMFISQIARSWKCVLQVTFQYDFGCSVYGSNPILLA